MPVSIRRTKPEKPSDDFPLTAHRCGQWCKKINGQLYYFGPWEDWQEALAVYIHRRSEIEAGQVKPGRVSANKEAPRKSAGGITVSDLCNHFLTVKELSMTGGTLSPQTFDEYQDVCKQVTAHLGRNRTVKSLTPTDFAGLKQALAQGVNGPVSIERLVKLIGISRSIFMYGEKNRLYSGVVFGTEFVRPSQKQRRLAKAKRKRNGEGNRMFASEDIRSILDIANPQMKALVLLALNSGMGNTDLALMSFGVLDLDKAFIDYPRPKTGVERLIPPLAGDGAGRARGHQDETHPSIRHENIVFITQKGTLWARYDDEGEDGKRRRGVPVSPLTQAYRRLMERTGTRRKHRGFYSLRHTFRTLVDELPDRGAIDLVMGHEATNDMRIHYVEETDLVRLKRVVNHVRKWLYPRSPWPRRIEADED